MFSDESNEMVVDHEYDRVVEIKQLVEQFVAFLSMTIVVVTLQFDEYTLRTVAKQA